MQIIETISDMRQWSGRQRADGHRVVLVPTMGFLHQGHLALMRSARSHGDRVVASIFVNPTQFGSGEDFAGYPRDFERDRRMLEAEDVAVLFHPAVHEMYPAGAQTIVEVERLSLPLCGAARPGHFRGVATVVAKLFNIVQPQAAIFGEKDFQQLQIIKRMARDLCMDVEIIGQPIVRDADGLAMSSRNAYLNAAERQAAVCLSRALCKAERLFRRGATDAAALIAVVAAELAREPLAQVEYAKLCDCETLEEVQEIVAPAVLALAVRIGKARLIDNRVLQY
ncbi:MAG TPA: pantoate--beta-alanine ligase [Candidatus Binatus sp.]|nr:pantoate--beta-alanine ligase [Candidatus Binatus sp.]